MKVPVEIKISAQISCTRNFRNGLVLYESSASPIKKAKVLAAIIPSNCRLNKNVFCSKKSGKQAMDNRNIRKNEIPPKEGFAWGLHLIRDSEEFLMPRVDTNFKNNPFIKKESKTVHIK